MAERSLQELTDDELIERYKQAKFKVSAKNTGQMGVKILLNAGYGAIGNRWFKEYYDPDIARAITACGELTNKWVTKYLTEDLRNYANTPGFRYVVYGDTDSIYLCLTPIAKMNGWKELETLEYV
ncbi:MAG: DNA polymerase domain-containing protein, partial [Aeromonas popoffii]|uniref:DNA polymerase domain-containing protein n=1 Tax=Aeromonas popoffii TaxID=70856 RepID=UPI003F391FC4